jgi:UDP-N-acetylmuramyl pentapeptide phosphotransferase/UDP-N-acetylglucosamine-1-phosphate transferase
MKNPTFPALIFMTLAYCAGFVLIALALLVVRSIQKSPTTTGINAQNLAPIFDTVPVAIPLGYAPIATSKKPKATISSMLMEEFDRTQPRC